MRYLITAILILQPFAIRLNAQDARTDIEKINKVYSRERYMLELEYKVFEYFSAEQPMQVEDGVVKKDGDHLYYKLGPVESIQQKEYSVVADHDDKIIALLPREYNATDGKPFLPAQLDSLQKFCRKIDYQPVNAALSSYAFHFTGSQYEVVKVSFNPRNHQISKIELFYKEPVNLKEEEGAPERQPKMEIIYKKFDINPSFAAEQFNYNYFLVKEGKDYKPKPIYKDYTVVTQL